MTASPTPIADFRPVPCKICSSPSPLFGVVDFNKSCAEQKGIHLSLSGCPIYYRRCAQCGFTFTTAFDTWDHEAFHHHIYNDSYLVVDPDFKELRPTGNAAMIANTFALSRETMQILDYGGGSGLFAERLRAEGFSATTYDPFSEFNQMPEGRFDLLTCFEVMEHVPSPKDTAATMASLLKPGGAIFFSTLVQPQDFAAIGLTWWYASPRNGHISLHSSTSLARLFAPHGLRVSSFTEGFHIAYAEIPTFAAHLIRPA